MLMHLTELAKAAIFSALTVLLAFGLAVAPDGSGDRTQLLTMAAPGAVVLVMLLVVTRDGRTAAAWRDLGVHRSGRTFWLFAFLVPLTIIGLAYSALWLTPFARPALPGGGWIDLTLSTLLNLAVTTVFALPEEVGWRSYLLPRLLGLGARRATLLAGLVHGVFHLPLLLLTPVYHSAGDRLIVAPLFLLALTLAGPIYGYLRLASGSLWPVVFAHASVNVSWGFFDHLTVASDPVAVEYLAGESGLLPLLGYAVVAGWCLARLPSPPPGPDSRTERRRVLQGDGRRPGDQQRPAGDSKSTGGPHASVVSDAAGRGPRLGSRSPSQTR